jgi:hypothetical protein
MWTQYIAIDSFLHYGSTGLDRDQFAQFVGGTFSEWEVDCALVDRLFALSDINKDSAVDFTELMLLLSGIFLFINIYLSIIAAILFLC